MPLLLPVIAKARLTDNRFEQVYLCPGDKSHSIVDISFFLDLPNTNQKPNFVNVYLSNTRDKSVADPSEMIFSRIPLGLAEVSPELSKIVVGKNQVLYIELVGTGPVNVRVSGLEESNESVVKSGVLASKTSKANGVIELMKLDNPLTTFFTGTLTVINPDVKEDDENIVWVTYNDEVKDLEDKPEDRVQKLFTVKGETTLVENILLKPNERIYVSSKRAGTVFNLIGMIVTEQVQ